MSYDDDGDTELYQLPLAYYPEREDRLDHAFVGWWEEPELGGYVHVYDAVHDREAMAAGCDAFDAAVHDRRPLGAGTGCPGHDLDTEAHSTLFTGEQSNSSVAFGDDALLKVFRKITPGVNPDIAVHQVLTEAGSDHVAHLYGWLEVAGRRAGRPAPAGDAPAVPAHRHRRLGLRAGQRPQPLRRGRPARRRGRRRLRGRGRAARASRWPRCTRRWPTHFPTGSAPPTSRPSWPTRWRPGSTPRSTSYPTWRRTPTACAPTFAAVADVPAVTVQQIHGDLHLGQTLRTVKGWKIVDFEGEPAKPLAERVLPDSAWRDVAGMLRSFDYAPRVAERTAAGADDTGAEQRAFRAAEWADRNCAAFLDAYVGGRELTADEQVLLDAYVADKAVYETVYEARNRPTWVPVPLTAIERLGRLGPEQEPSPWLYSR